MKGEKTKVTTVGPKGKDNLGSQKKAISITAHKENTNTSHLKLFFLKNGRIIYNWSLN